MRDLLLFARNEAANQWLNEHPLALGGLFIALGAWLGFAGYREYKAGVAHDKYGNVIPGKMGTSASMLRIGIGSFCVLFGLYKAVVGMF